MRNLKILSALGVALVAGSAHAGVSSTWTLASEYDYRGNSQTARDPAVQASLDFAADNGWYLGGWASNVEFGDATDYELDLYSGFSGRTQSGLAWDAGLLYYAYEESDYNFLEGYAGIGYGWVKGKVSYSHGFGGDAARAIALQNTGKDHTAAWYLEGSAAIPLARNVSVLLHAGMSTGDYWDNVAGDDILDYSLGVGYAIDRFNLTLRYVDTQTDAVVTDDLFNNEGRVVFTITTVFPPQ